MASRTRGEEFLDPDANDAETICMQNAAMKRCEWQLKVAIIKAVTDSGGIVFGGAVRDYWVHDQKAAAFYRDLKAISGGAATGAATGAAAAGEEERLASSVVYGLYNDAEFMPEHSGRRVMPYDVDAYIHETRVSNLLYALSAAHFGVSLLSDSDPCDYIANTTLLPGQVRHQRYRVYGFPMHAGARIRRAINDQISQSFHHVFEGVIADFCKSMRETMPMFPSVAVDLMVSHVPLPVGTLFASGILSAAAGQPMPPFANLDFECNSLVLTRDGIGLSEHMKAAVGAKDNPMKQQQEMQRILEETLEWKARLAQPEPAPHRIRKMVRKGFRVVGFKHTSEVAGADGDDADSGDRCLICHGDLVGSHYKLNCCEGRYHARCLERAGSLGANAIKESETCPMCRQHRPGLRGDMCVLSAILSVIPVVTDSDSDDDADANDDAEEPQPFSPVASPIPPAAPVAPIPPVAPVSPVAPPVARAAAAIVQATAAAAAARVSALSQLAPLRVRAHSEVVIRYTPRNAEEARAALRSLQAIGGSGGSGGSSGSGEEIVANGNLVAEVSQSRMSDVD